MRVLIVDDQELAREGIRAILHRAEDVEVVGEAGDAQEALTLTRQLAPDIVLMDIALPGADGLQATGQICREQPKARVLILTQYMDDFLLQTAIRHGAKGFVCKSEMGSELVPALHALFKGSEYYSSSVVKLLAEWNRNQRRHAQFRQS